MSAPDAPPAGSAAGTPTGPSADADDGWRRLTPLMLLVHPVREVIKVVPLVVPAYLFGRSFGHHNNWAFVVTGLAVGAGLLRWWTTRYRVRPGLVELRHGLLVRRHVAVPADRVRTVDLHAAATHRLLGLMTVTVGTGEAAARRGDRLKLDALRRPEALALREQLLGGGAAVEDAATAGPARAGGTVLLRFSPGWLRYAPFALTGFLPLVLMGLALIGPLAGAVEQTPIGSLLEWALHQDGLGPRAVRVPAAVLLAGTVINLLTFVERTAGFVLTRRPGGALEIGHGLVNRRAVALERSRVHGVELSESLPVRLLGGARCTAVSTGAHRERGGPALVPAAPLPTALAVAGQVLGSDGPARAGLTGHGPRARTRRLTRALAGWALGVGLFAAAAAPGRLPWWCALGWAALLPLTVPLALDRYRSLGHAVVDGFLVVRHGSLVRRRAVLAGGGVIGWNLRTSWGQRRAGLVTLTATTAAGRKAYRAADLPVELLPELAEQVLPGLLEPFLVDAELPAQRGK
ncbi:PH domain-containing protein [Kitasatospora sp. NPDC088134]|uniref:PH domain-containing protein n=1 Tax=Kitasatospora sp. NPDC088134 TaxID=3364071 RepID=UPI003817FD84